MKRAVWCVAMCLLVGLSAWSQDTQKTDQPQQEERPTLGPRNGPAVEAGARTYATTDMRRLMRIRSLYIERIDNSLSDKLLEALGKWGRFKIVTNPKEADATLRGSCLDSRHTKHVHSEIYISDRSGASVWQDTIYRPFNPPSLDEAVTNTAQLVVGHLEETLRAGERK